jgi:ABC-type branched-subunit amino acid transport system substrate-binding protein
MGARRGAVAATLAVLIAAAGCGSGDGQGPGLAESANGGVRLYGSDGNMSNSFGDGLKDAPGVLNGMKGTTPLTPLSEDFKRRVRAVDAGLADVIYAGEAYDAVVVPALAAEIAKTTEPTTVAKYVNGVTVDGTVCETVRACLELIHAGKNIQYRGVTLRRSGFTDVGEPSSASYGTLTFGRDNHIDDGKTEFVGAGDESAQTKQPSPSSSGKVKGSVAALKIGGLLPHTGSLAIAGPPMFAGARLAVREINAAGGILGQDVIWVDGDDGTSPNVAATTVDRFIDNGVQVIIGAGGSGVSLAVLPKVIAAGRLMISPSATSDALTKFDDHGLFFRTSPPDVLQAKALADIVMRDGSQKVLVVARDDSYGTGLQRNLLANLTTAGIRSGNVSQITYKAKDKYDAGADLPSIFAPVARSIRQFAPDAVVIIGFEESALVIKAMLTANVRLHS